MPRLSCKFADPDSLVSSAAARRVQPDTMSCGSDGCRDGGSGGSEEFRRPRPSKVAADDLVEPARCSDATAPASWIDRKLLVDPRMLFIGSKIGEGAHGKVYKGKYGDQIVAIKVLNNGSTPEERATLEARFIREVNMMCRVKHDNLVKFIGACKEPLMVIVSELLPGMSLKSYLNSIRPSQLEIHTAIGYALNIAHAMECLHANGIIHRDLKPDNLLLTANRKKLKLTDFGLAREETVTEMMTAETGTYRWMAPELYSTVTLQRGEKKHYTNKVDVYSFGIVLWELLTNKMPFEGMSNLQAAYAAAFKQVRPPLPEETPQELVFIVQSCWVEDPVMRPSFSQIIRMLDAFLMTIPPPPPSESDEDVESEETTSSLSRIGRAVMNGENGVRQIQEEQRWQHNHIYHCGSEQYGHASSRGDEPGTIPREMRVDNGYGVIGRREGGPASSYWDLLRAHISDPVTGVLMDDAMILSCGHSYGSSGMQHIYIMKACGKCGQPITEDSIRPNLALRLAVQAFKREEESAKALKRRRERLEQDKCGNDDPNPTELSRGNGVQFPFAVFDRVIIKGNKRTPERFVGRVAVVTAQCLNGWYVVKTLDNAESVKLQYRSLAKFADGGESSAMVSNNAQNTNWL